VTVVSGLPPEQADTLTRELKAACGSGGTYKNGRLELQGDHRDRVEEALHRRGIRSKRAGG
jgi:translation initiation factor 1